MVKQRKQRFLTEDARQRMSMGKKGKTVSEHTRKLLSIALSKPRGQYTRIWEWIYSACTPCQFRVVKEPRLWSIYNRKNELVFRGGSKDTIKFLEKELRRAQITRQQIANQTRSLVDREERDLREKLPPVKEWFVPFMRAYTGWANITYGGLQCPEDFARLAADNKQEGKEFTRKNRKWDEDLSEFLWKLYRVQPRRIPTRYMTPQEIFNHLVKKGLLRPLKTGEGKPEEKI